MARDAPLSAIPGGARSPHRPDALTLCAACGRCTFRLGYIVYTTRVGGWLHARSLRSAAASGQPGRRHSTPPPPLVTSTAVVYTVPILESNYTYLLVDSATRLAAAVDPADPAAVLAAAASVGCELAAILTTHGHHDHAGGNAALCDAVRGRTGRALLVAGAGPGRCCGGGRGGGGVERVPRLNRPVADGDVLQLGATRVRAVATPCHTRGSVAYEVLGPGDGGGAAEAVFSGDTVFIGGVGAFFHGSAADMAACVAKLDARVPPGGACALLCGHEYAADNLRFAAWVEPRNDEVVAAYCAAAAARQAGRATVPGTVGAERLTNPYFRAASPRLQRAVAHRLARGGGAGAGPPAARPSPATRLVAAALAPLRRASPPPQPSQQPQPPGENGAPAPALPPPLPAAEVYARLQMLLASGEWQHFRVTEARRARALAAVAVHRAAQQLATGLAAAGAGAGGRGGATTQLSPPPAQQAPR